MSAASDAIWDLVSGFPEPVRSNRWLLMLTAYVDDSNIGQGAVSVLAGWVAPTKTWAQFANCWQAALEMKPRVAYFKWAEMRGSAGEFSGISDQSKREKINLLASIIGRHMPLGIASGMPNDLYREIFGRLPDPAIRSPYFLSFYGIIAQLVEYLRSTGSEDRVDFVFDVQYGQMARVLASWEAFLSIAPPAARKILGDPPIFRDDKRTVPLQAADLIAGFKREQYDDTYHGRISPDAPWGDLASNVQSLERYWNREMMQNVRARLDAIGL